jgi:hypothetical protein
METLNGHDFNSVPTESEKIARIVSPEGQLFYRDPKSVDELVKDEAESKFNDQVEQYVKKLDEHAELLKKYQESLCDDLEKLEIKVIGIGLLIKPFEENPFQTIRRTSKGLITDVGGLKPIYKSRETGDWEEEEQFIHVGTVIDNGPACKWVREGDIVMWRKVSETPVPFYKQGLVLVAEQSIMTVVNQGLTARFNEMKENG